MMYYVNALTRLISHILLHLLVWANHQRRQVVQFLVSADRNPDHMVPTWGETWWPLFAAILVVLAVYFVLTVGGD